MEACAGRKSPCEREGDVKTKTDTAEATLLALRTEERLRGKEYKDCGSRSQKRGSPRSLRGTFVLAQGLDS